MVVKAVCQQSALKSPGLEQSFLLLFCPCGSILSPPKPISQLVLSRLSIMIIIHFQLLCVPNFHSEVSHRSYQETFGNCRPSDHPQGSESLELESFVLLLTCFSCFVFASPNKWNTWSHLITLCTRPQRGEQRRAAPFAAVGCAVPRKAKSWEELKELNFRIVRWLLAAWAG